MWKLTCQRAATRNRGTSPCVCALRTVLRISSGHSRPKHVGRVLRPPLKVVQKGGQSTAPVGRKTVFDGQPAQHAQEAQHTHEQHATMHGLERLPAQHAQHAQEGQPAQPTHEARLKDDLYSMHIKLERQLQCCCSAACIRQCECNAAVSLSGYKFHTICWSQDSSAGEGGQLFKDDLDRL